MVTSSGLIAHAFRVLEVNMLLTHDQSPNRADFLCWLKNEYKPIFGGWQY
jgi:hypothetical protein